MCSDAGSRFVHLHNHTNFSLLDGATRIDLLMDRCVELGMPAVAMTDHGNMFGAIQFYRAAKAKGIKPIIGMEAYLAPGARDSKTTGPRGGYASHLLLIAKNLQGYRNLLKLSSVGYLEGFYYRPRIDRDLLAEHSDGLIATTSCLSGEVSQCLLNGDMDGARRVVGEMIAIFGRDNYYVELQDQGLDEQRRINPDLVRLAQEFNLTLVATNDCHYLRQEDSAPHDVLLCIQTGKGINEPGRMKFPNQEFYVKTPDEMAQVFREVPQSLGATAEIAERCNVELSFEGHHLPNFPVPDGYTLDDYFEATVRQGFDERMLALGYGNGSGPAPPDYLQRLDYEVGVIREMGFPGYFMIVWDFIRFAKEQRIPVGPGRGSAAGSLVAYAMGITDVDPMHYGLVFERFLNVERISMPDIDIDFCMRRRGEVIEYVAEKYGHDRVAHIITFGTMAAKAAIRDVGRALEMSFGDVDKVAKMIPADLGATIAGAKESNEDLRDAIDEDEQVARLVELAEGLEGQIRHASTHAAGVVISDEPLTEYVPLYKAPGGKDEMAQLVTTQFPMNDVEAIGLLKMDFLGLRTLTLVHDALSSISREKGKPFTADDIPLDNKKTYRLFAKGNTSGIFQFESSGMREYLKKLKPSELNDLIAMNALYRPGPIGSGMIDEYIERKRDPSQVIYELPQLEDILQETYGVIVYQEQVMRIAAALAGFSLGQADILRKAMGKKKPEVMESMAKQFLEGCEAKEVPARPAKKIWDLIVEFAGYGFNKSHSAAYALLAYQTGFLKANYPVHFMAAVLTNEESNTDKVVQYINECRGMGVKVLPPDINESQVHFTPVGEDIRFGLAAIKGVGEGAVEIIIEARERVGEFRNLVQFCEKVDLRSGINRKTLESLLKAGAMDSLVPDPEIDARSTRALLEAQLEGALQAGQQKQRDLATGQGSLLDGMEGSSDTEPVPLGRIPEPWTERDMLAAEKESLGFYVSGHPLQRYAEQLDTHADTTTVGIASARARKELAIGGMVLSIRQMTTRKGDRMAILQIEDMEGQARVVVFPKVYQKCATLLVEEAVLLVRGRKDTGDDDASILASSIESLTGITPPKEEPTAQSVEVVIQLDQLVDDVAGRLREVLERHRGNTPIVVQVRGAQPTNYRARITPNRYLFVEPTDALVGEIEEIVGADAVLLR
ncbi:MAG: DNA polymerase III subunit alpha [Acidobacteria bacterium]|nr:DNA polymerase III subunit alpha [Acidobacteriota bacterium]